MNLYLIIALISLVSVAGIGALWWNILTTEGGTSAQLRLLAWESCPEYETTPNTCRCPCEGCKHHCSAHYGWQQYMLDVKREERERRDSV